MLSISILFFSCENKNKRVLVDKTALEILGNPNYLAISYGGYREKTRDIQPTIFELKEDMKILSAMGVKILRTYNLQLDQASNILGTCLFYFIFSYIFRFYDNFTLGKSN